MTVVDETTGGAQEMSRTTPIRRQIRRVLVAVALADLLVVSASVALAWKMRLAFDVWLTNIDAAQSLSSTAGPWIILVWVVFLAAQGAYSTKLFGSGPDEFRTVFLASALAAGSIGTVCYLLEFELSRGFLLLTFFLGIPLLLLERYGARKILHQFRQAGRFQHRVVAVGGPSGIAELVGVLRRESYLGYQVICACVPDGITVDPTSTPVPVLGSVEKTRSVCEHVGADTVMVTGGGYSSSADLRQIAWDLEGSDIELVVAPGLTDVAGPRIHMRPVAGLPLLHVESPQADEAGGWTKRVFDIAIASAALLVLSPVLLVSAAVIKLQDGGPVVFRQSRVGRHGTPFNLVKFRSMVRDAELRLDEIRHLNEHDDILFKIRLDPRITPFGRFIRKHSIDELPQLLNVIRGDMSLVGPRPPLAKEVENYEVDARRRLLVRPGMTGLWQVSGRSDLSWSESVRLDLYYVDNWSMFSDLVIMAKTARAVLGSGGAY